MENIFVLVTVIAPPAATEIEYGAVVYGDAVFHPPTTPPMKISFA